MALDFGLDLDELTSAFDAKDTSVAGSSDHVNKTINASEFAEKKRKAEASLRPLLNEVSEDSADCANKRSKLTSDLEALEFKAPRIKIHKIAAPESCTHEVAVPPDMDYQPLTKDTNQPARTYPFTLDAFQQQAITCIDNNQSVMISAHTSAGKTVVAEYVSYALRFTHK
ncbi:hypothetical protein AHF37_04331 [Paragonimus kellicotti]|nr:hypothetical protein AHF37_04331 [Paragonimus kellicotti]